MINRFACQLSKVNKWMGDEPKGEQTPDEQPSVNSNLSEETENLLDNISASLKRKVQLASEVRIKLTRLNENTSEEEINSHLNRNVPVPTCSSQKMIDKLQHQYETEDCLSLCESKNLVFRGLDSDQTTEIPYLNMNKGMKADEKRQIKPCIRTHSKYNNNLSPEMNDALFDLEQHVHIMLKKITMKRLRIRKLTDEYRKKIKFEKSVVMKTSNRKRAGKKTENDAHCGKRKKMQVNQKNTNGQLEKTKIKKRNLELNTKNKEVHCGTSNVNQTYKNNGNCQLDKIETQSRNMENYDAHFVTSQESKLSPNIGNCQREKIETQSRNMENNEADCGPGKENDIDRNDSNCQLEKIETQTRNMENFDAHCGPSKEYEVDRNDSNCQLEKIETQSRNKQNNDQHCGPSLDDYDFNLPIYVIYNDECRPLFPFI